MKYFTSIIETIIGGIVVAFSSFFLIVYFLNKDLNDVPVLSVFLVLLAIGTWLFTAGIKAIKLIKKYKLYNSAISLHEDGSIPAIAGSLCLHADVVRKELKQMISKKFFPDAVIDFNSDCIVNNKQNEAKP